MNFACKEAMGDKEKITISFFFNARGESLERSTPGMYRSLLFQLLHALPSLLEVFDEPGHKAALEEMHTAILSQRDPVWKLRILQDLLRSALAKLGQTPLAIFVDALDECATDQAEELVEYFEELGHDAVQNDSRLNICFSSRYYPHIDIQFGRKINLEAQGGHEQDIRMYIRNKLRVGKSKTAEEVKTQIQAKAKGIFMWVILVVDILKAEYRGGRIFNVKKRLAALPAKLSELFKEILLRDQQNIQDLRLCVQWILFSARPLKLEEYYFACVSGLSPNELCEWDPDEVTTNDMQLFVTSSSKGLAEMTKTKQTVQFIHESVREFFLKDGLHELWPNVSTADFESVSQSELAQYCSTYIGLNIEKYVPEILPKASSDDAKELRGAVSRKLPFLEYATKHVFSHADAAAKSIPQHNILETVRLDVWIHLHNLFEKFHVRCYTEAASLLYILAEKNFVNLIKQAKSLGCKTDIGRERYCYPLFAALANGNLDAVKALLQTEAGNLPEEVFARLDYGPNFKVIKRQTPLS